MELTERPRINSLEGLKGYVGGTLAFAKGASAPDHQKWQFFKLTREGDALVASSLEVSEDGAFKFTIDPAWLQAHEVVIPSRKDCREATNGHLISN